MLAGSLLLQADASDPQAGVNRVEFLVDGNEVGEDSSAPYEFFWNSSDIGNGPHTIAARAVNNGPPVLSSTSSHAVTAQNAFSLTNPIGFGAGDDPNGVLAADLNGDGQVDIVTANRLSNNVSVLLGNGVGFDAAVSYPAGSEPINVAAGDLNGDSKVDLVTANLSGGPYVLPGDGNGAFGAAVPYPTGERSFSIAVEDLNQDGRLDIATANRDGSVSVLLGTPDGTLAPPLMFPVEDYALSLAADDLNGDGKIDLVTVHELDEEITVLLGNGDGTFQPAVSPEAPRAHAVIASDFNEDGKVDLMLLRETSNVVSILLGNGDGSFEAFASYGPGVTSIAIGDLNGDGSADFVSSEYGADRIWVGLGNGDGSFAAAVEFDAGGAPVGVAVADVTGDGKPEVLAANTGSGPRSDRVSVLRNRTLFGPPRASTGPADAVSATMATLTGTVGPSGETSYYFEYGPTAGYGARTATRGAGSFPTKRVSEVLSGLAAATTFHYRLVGTSVAGGTSYGEDRTFTTLPRVAAADTTTPVVTLVIKARQKLLSALRKGLRATAGCSEACAMQAKLLITKKLAKKLKLPTVVGKATANLAAAGTTNLVVKFTAKAKRKLAKLRSVRVTLELLATDPAANAATARKTLTLKR